MSTLHVPTAIRDRRGWAAACLLAALPAVCVGDDWPQWRGPNRDGVWRERGIVTAIPAAGLPVQWRTDVGGGYGGPAVADGRVYLLDYVRREGAVANAPNSRTALAGSERVLCLDATTGQVLWKHEYDCPYSISYASGPRCTPTVVDGRVYALGAEGRLSCLDAKTGAVLWEKDFRRDYAAPTPLWGFCGHPLVEGDALLCLVGGPGSVAVAFDRRTGRELWKALTASESGYCPPTMIEAAGTRQLVIWDADNLNSLDPASGSVHWSQPLKPMYGMSIMAPQVADGPDGRVLFASGIGRVGAVFRLAADKPGATVLWRGEPKSAVYCANSTPFIVGGTIYGCDCDTGMLTAVELATGRRLWETAAPTTGDRRGKHGTAFLVREDAAPGPVRTWLFSETGDLVLARLSAEKYEEIGRMHLVDPTNECFGREVVWSHPAFARGCIFVRNDRELVCVRATE
ncbi:MAG: PQQ-binding-like beta-propeller repeat protein [Planctomycetia bacterium]|jgi:outer membrane protein assembly factor BamB